MSKEQVIEVIRRAFEDTKRPDSDDFVHCEQCELFLGRFLRFCPETLHDFRRTAVRNLERSGVPLGSNGDGGSQNGNRSTAVTPSWTAQRFVKRLRRLMLAIGHNSGHSRPDQRSRPRSAVCVNR